MVNLPMVKGYNIYHLQKLLTPRMAHLSSALIPYFPAPGSMVRNRRQKYPAWLFTE